jgi:hypothetical protein
MSEAFHLFGQGKKSISVGEFAQWVLSVPIGTFAVTAKVEILSQESGLTNVPASLSSEGQGIITSETRPDSVNIGLNGFAERNVATLQAVVATNSPAKVFLRCGVTTGNAQISNGTITAIRLDDPNHLHITNQNVQ